MTLQRFGGAAAFSSSAESYQATMAPALRPVAMEVVRRACLQPGETILDVGTGTGTAAEMAVGDGRHVIGIDAAPGMLELARRGGSEAAFMEADFVDLPFHDGTHDVVLAVHALLFAGDRVRALREWRRVTRPGGRLSLSVPGPGDVVPISVLGPVYDRYGIAWGDDYPTVEDVATWALNAGWVSIETAADPTVAILLADDDAFRTWLRVGARGRATGGWSDEHRERFAGDLMAISPREADGAYRLPFGALYLTGRRAA